MDKIKKYVYLFELDSVRKTDKEIIKGQNALMDEIIYKGNVVVLTFNQFAESRGFYTLLVNEDYKKNLLKLFKRGLIKINRYGDTRTISQYLINSVDKEDGFIYSALPLKASQKRLAALFKRSLIYSDLSEVNYYLELISKFEKGEFRQEEAQEDIDKISKLFCDNHDENKKIINYTCKNDTKNSCKGIWKLVSKTIKNKNNLKCNEGLEIEKKILEALKSVLQLIFELSLYDDIYIDPVLQIPKEDKNNQYDALINYIDIILKYLLDKKENDSFFSDKERIEIMEAIKIIKGLDSYKKSKDNRSSYIQEIIKDHKEREIPCRYALGIIDLCYNFKCENSIANISTHYDLNDFENLKNKNIKNLNIKNNTFIWDFKNRLKLYIEDTLNIPLDNYLSSNYSTIKEKKDTDVIIKKIKIAAKLSENWHIKNSINNKVYSYEYKEKDQEKKQALSSLGDALKNICSIIVLYYLSYIVTVFLKSKMGNLFISSFLASSVGLFLIDFARKFVSDFLSNFFTINSRYSLSLTDTILNLIKEIANLFLFIIYSFKKQIYSNIWNNLNNDGIDVKRTKYIELIIPKELKYYKKWYNNKNESLYIENNNDFYKIVDPNDNINLEKIIISEEINNNKYGIIYSSNYRKLIVDPIQNEKGITPYERIVPNNENGVVMMVK